MPQQLLGLLRTRSHDLHKISPIGLQDSEGGWPSASEVGLDGAKVGIDGAEFEVNTGEVGVDCSEQGLLGGGLGSDTDVLGEAGGEVGG